LLYAFDWTSYQSGVTSGSLIDRSANANNAIWYDGLTTSSNHLQFNGTSSYIAFNTSSAYAAWDYTAQWRGTIASSGSFGGTTYDWTSLIHSSGGFTAGYPFGWVLNRSGSYTSLNYNRGGFVPITVNELTASLVNQSFTLTGTTAVPPINVFTGSIVREYYNNELLPNSGSNATAFQSFNWSNEHFFGKGYVQSFGAINFFNNFLSGSAKYITVYNRPLSAEEIAANNCFFDTGLPIPQAALTPTTTTTLAPTTTTTASPTTTTTASPTTTIAPTTTTTTIPACLCYYILNETGGNLSYEYDDCQFGYTSGNLGGGANIRVCSSNYPSGTGLTIAPCVSQTGCTISGDCVFCT
jgi:hypothetical protein